MCVCVCANSIFERYYVAELYYLTYLFFMFSAM